jgi:hypothetical protein
MNLIVTVLFWIVGFVILYYVVRAAVRDGMMAAWKARKRAEREASGWDPQSGQEGFR